MNKIIPCFFSLSIICLIMSSCSSDEKPTAKVKRAHVENVLSDSCSKENIAHLLENKWDFEINDIILRKQTDKIKSYDIYVKDFVNEEQELIKDIVEAKCLHTSNDKLMFVLKSRTCKAKWLKSILNKSLKLDKMTVIFKQLNYTYYKIEVNGNTPLNRDYAVRLQKTCL